MAPKPCFFYPYQYGTELQFTNTQRDNLLRLFEEPPQDIEAVLAGRTQVVRTLIDPVGPVVIKYYKRGGLVRHFMKDVYLRTKTPRPSIEYDMLEKVGNMGVNCPAPVLWAIRGGMFYKAFLVTRDIGPHRSLAELGLLDESVCTGAIMKAGEQIHRLIENRIHHVDLHPGNILSDDRGTVFIIDFDKAYVSSRPLEKLRAIYLERWKRAVLKHGLPTFLIDTMEKALPQISH